MQRVISTFANPTEHAAVSDIIRRRSTNRTDVREAALDGFDIGDAREVLDLGCGIGYMSGAVAARCAGDATIHGIDRWEENEPGFRKAIEAAGRRAEFQAFDIRDRLPHPDASFDLVVASWTLYFFVEILPEAARVLKPGGRLLAVTHYRETCANVIRAAGLRFHGTPLELMMRSFCAENGHGRLEQVFGRVDSVDYPNTLEFLPDHSQDLLRLAVFKLPQLAPSGEVMEGMAEQVGRSVLEQLEREGRFVIEKSDAIFHCRRPRCP
jgi:SAM-dependent methyltransferase